MPSWQHSSKFILLVIDRAGPSYCTLFLLRERDKLLDTMNTEILNGRALAKTIKNDLTSHVATLKKQPQLRIVSIGEDAASKIYIQQKVKFGQAIGVKVAVDTYDSGVTTNSLLNAIVSLNNNEAVTGYIIQLPLPQTINAPQVFEAISPLKDADGLSNTNIGRLTNGHSSIIPATTRAITRLLQSNSIPLEGKNILVVGRSNLVGKPTALHLTNLGATVTIAHSKTTNLSTISSQSDIVITATGHPKLLTRGDFKPGAMVIDVGINRTSAGIVGDVDSADLEGHVAAYTPVPGGVGPLTVACLFENVVNLAKLQSY